MIMKVGTLTFPNSPSHGAALQMYALWKTLIDLGCDAEVINYTTDIVIHSRNKSVPLSLKSKLKSIIFKAILKSNTSSFRDFESLIAKYPNKPISCVSDINSIADRYDRIIVGSDQVWNPVVTGNDMNFYLKFLNDSSVKASYAPSFGNDDVAAEDKAEISLLLSDFKYLCAREKQGADIIKSLTGREVPIVLDPTFLVDCEHWKTIETKPKYKKDYVLFYNIKPSKSLLAFAQRLADANNCILVTIGGRVADKFNPKKHPAFGVGPSEFLGLISNAKYVVTNSFHGTALSLIYNKNFYIEYSTDTNSRLINLANIFGFKDNIVNDNTDVHHPISVDYDHINKVLNIEKEKSLEYLRSIIKG